MGSIIHTGTESYARRYTTHVHIESSRRDTHVQSVSLSLSLLALHIYSKNNNNNLTSRHTYGAFLYVCHGHPILRLSALTTRTRDCTSFPIYEVSTLNIACLSSVVPALLELPASLPCSPSALVFTTSRLSQPIILHTHTQAHHSNHSHVVSSAQTHSPFPSSRASYTRTYDYNQPPESPTDTHMHAFTLSLSLSHTHSLTPRSLQARFLVHSLTLHLHTHARTYSPSYMHSSTSSRGMTPRAVGLLRS